MSGWEALDEELARHAAPIPFWWRDDDATERGAHPLEPSAAVAREGPRAPIAVELLDEADEVRRVHLVRGQRGGHRARRARALVVEDHRRLVFAADRLARLARARRRHLPGGGHAAGIRACGPSNESPPPGRFTPSATVRGRVSRQRCPPPRRERRDDLRVSRVNNDDALLPAANHESLTLENADPYGAADWFDRRVINGHPAIDPLPGSLASACDPSGGEGVGTGRVR